MFNTPEGEITPLDVILRESPPVVPADWGQGRTAFGGLSSLIAVRALQAAVDAASPPDTPRRALQSVTVHFIGPVAIGPVEVSAEVVRSGRYMSQSTATLRSKNTVALTALGAHGQSRPSALELPPLPAPELPPPHDLPAMPYVPGVMPAFTQHIDYRWATPHFPFTGGPSPELRGWCRARSNAPLDAALVMLLIDSWPAGILTMAPGFVAASSVMWMVTFAHHAPLPPGTWLKSVQRTTMSQGGHAENVADVWTADGTLVARSRQLVALFG